MQDLEKLKEIEELGLEEPDSPGPQEPIPLQSLEAPAYDTFTAWYQQEASQEIQLPAWEEALPQEPTVGPSPSAQPTPSPSPWEGEAYLQRI